MLDGDNLHETEFLLLSRFLGTKPQTLARVFDDLKKATNNKNFDSDVYQVFMDLSKSFIQKLELPKNPSALDAYKKIHELLEASDQRLFEVLEQPYCTTMEGCSSLINSAIALQPPAKGFFLKKEKARELLLAVPPPNLLATLRCPSCVEMLAQEDLFEVYSALRFVETRDWMNRKFLPQYQHLSPDDFEERNVEVRVLSRSKWFGRAQAFAEKKFHNVSHLKELGVIFEIPLRERQAGVTMRLFTLILHYINELDFYSRFFREQSKANKDFGNAVIYALRGDWRPKVLRKNPLFLIIQQYLAKDRAHPLLAFPHVNPEVEHWHKAEESILRLGRISPFLNLEIWTNTDAAGAFLPAGKTKTELISFNIFDNILSLANRRSFARRYDYHFRECLWNQIAYVAAGTKDLTQMLIENLYQGYLTKEDFMSRSA